MKAHFYTLPHWGALRAARAGRTHPKASWVLRLSSELPVRPQVLNADLSTGGDGQPIAGPLCSVI